MTLAEAMRLSRETGCEFWRGKRPLVKFRCKRGLQSSWAGGRWFRHHAEFTVREVLADDWQVSQTAPHEEGM